jgi:6-phosphogluconolactonase
MATNREVVVFANPAVLQQAAAERVAEDMRQAVAARGRCIIALSGGSTPRGLHQRLAATPLRDRIPWQHMYVIWGDERYVPHTDPESNYRMARETLLDHVPIPADQILPMPTSAGDPAQAAAGYEQQLRRLAGNAEFRIDIAIMGMGPDGHTASLFPEHPGLDAPAGQLVIAIDGSPKPPPRRLTLTIAALNRVGIAMFLVAGADKAEMVRDVLQGPAEPRRRPAQFIQAPQGRLIWLLDAAAGASLA